MIELLGRAADLLANCCPTRSARASSTAAPPRRPTCRSASFTRACCRTRRCFRCCRTKATRFSSTGPRRSRPTPARWWCARSWPGDAVPGQRQPRGHRGRRRAGDGRRRTKSATSYEFPTLDRGPRPARGARRGRAGDVPRTRRHVSRGADHRPIPGVSATNTVTFYEISASEPVEVTSSSAERHAAAGGRELLASSTASTSRPRGTNPRAVEITGNSDHNAIRNATISGAGVATTSTHGVYITAAATTSTASRTACCAAATTPSAPWARAAPRTPATSSSTAAIDEGKYWRLPRAAEQHARRGLRHPAGLHGFEHGNLRHQRRRARLGLHLDLREQPHPQFPHLLGRQRHLHQRRRRAARLQQRDLRFPGAVATARSTASAPPAAPSNSTTTASDIGDVATTGGTIGINGFYESTPSTTVTLKNNVFRITEPTSA